MRDDAERATLPSMKRFLSVLLAGSAVVSLAFPANAVPPEISRYGFSVRQRIGPSVCGFPFVFVVTGKGQTLMFKDRDGDIVRGLATGPITITFENRSSGEAVRYSISGPSFFDADGDLLRGTGRWFAFTADGEPAIVIGNLTFGPDGVPEDAARSIDVCDALS
jgi:hypothetical protein